MTMQFYTDYRLGGIPRHYVSDKEDKMLVPDEVRKCVVFLLYLDKNQRYQFAGTGFFFGVDADELGENDIFIHLITAKHVIVGIQQRGIDSKVYIRMNNRSGGAQMIATPIEKWFDHPTDSSVDVSIFRWSPPHDVFDYLVIPGKMLATEQVIKAFQIGIGDEVFVTGLFANHFGKSQNIPIVRVGNIASMPVEKVDTNHFGSIDAFLIECRSIGGLSGSPVFVHLGLVRNVQGKIKFADNTSAGMFLLLGVMHGHWDRAEREDDLSEDIDGGKVNMGIAIVIPATKILEIVNQPAWVKERRLAVQEEKKKQLPTQDANLPSQDSIEPNENDGITKEEFEDALRKIARPLPKDEPKKKGT